MRFATPFVLLLGTAVTTTWSAISGLDIAAIKGPSCVVVDSARNAQIPLAPFFTRVNVVVGDGLAQATVIQSFANPLSKSTEIAYVFPLPEKGAVHAMSYQLHDTLYRATVQEKTRAQAIYDSIKAIGGNAAILLQERPNIFQQKMASIRPHDTVHVQIEVSIPLKYADGAWELAFPTMVGERYQSAGTPGAVGTISGWNPPENREGPGFQFNVLVKNIGVDSIWSPSHPLQFQDPATARQILSARGLIDSASPALPSSYGKAITLAPQNTYPNRDYVLRLRRASTGVDAIASSWKPAGHDTGYFHLAVLPDLSANAGARLPLDVVLLVDRSGSQAGWPMEREKQLATGILDRLTSSDRFTLLAFDDLNEYALGAAPVLATAANIDSAKRFVASIQARGSTYLLAAVKAALATPITPEMQRLVVLLTDGFITDEAAILDALAKKSPQPQVITFGCGDNLNRYFLEEAANVGSGFATILLSTDPVTPALDAAWSRIETPQVAALRIDFGSMGAHDLVLPGSERLYKGLPLVAEGKYLHGGKQTITLKGQRNGAAWALAREVELVEDESIAWAVPKTWARASIGKLDLAEGTTTTNKDSIVKLSVAYQVLSKYTAFLATVGSPIEPDASLANAYHSSLITEVHQKLSQPRNSIRLRVASGKLLVRWGAMEKIDRIRVFDVSGTVIASLVVDSRSGMATWDGMSQRGVRAIAGTYLLEVRSASSTHRQSFTWIP
ncbi:MAG: VIT domain-containing protein [Fibrobacterota bacterium]